MTTSDSKELNKYKEYVKAQLAKLTPILQKTSVGDFSGQIEIPEKEDEFTELLVGLSLMMDDLRALEKTQEQSEEERKKRLNELEQWRKLMIGREIKMVALKKELKGLELELKRYKKVK